MAAIESLNQEDKKIYYNNFFSGDYNQDMYLKKSEDDGSHKDKFYLELYTTINGVKVMQGYLYFYLDLESRSCHFIGMKVLDEYKNLNMGSLLISAWINFCLCNGCEHIAVHPKQRKPFILYLLKTYSFDVKDLSQYKTRSDVITICRSVDLDDTTRYLMFRDERHQRNFLQTNICRSDDYKIAVDPIGLYPLGEVIFPLQDITRNPVEYILQDKSYARYKSNQVLLRHKR